LLDEPADGRDFGDTGDASELISQRPILERAEAGQVLIGREELFVSQWAEAGTVEGANLYEKLVRKLLS